MIKRNLPLLANFAAQTLFGLSYLFTRMGMAVVDQDSVKLLAFRFCLGFLALSLLVILRLKHMRMGSGRGWMILLCGLFNPLISQVLEVSSTSYAPTSQIYMYNSLLPIVMIGVSALINKEYPTGKQMAFCLMTVVGVFIARLADQDATGLSLTGMVLIVCTIVAVSISRALVRRTTAYFGSFEIVYWTTAMGAVGFSAFSVGRHLAKGLNFASYFEPLCHEAFLAAIFYLGIGAACGAFLLMTYASANLPYTVYSSTCTLSTVVGILAGVLILHETFQIQEIIGTIVILLGVIGVSFSYDKSDRQQYQYRA